MSMHKLETEKRMTFPRVPATRPEHSLAPEQNASITCARSPVRSDVPSLRSTSPSIGLFAGCTTAANTHASG